MPRQCQHCGTAVTLAEPTPRESSCDGCGRDFHACRQCRHYDPTRNNSCRETEAELVEDKERRNFCEFFAFNPAPFRPVARDAGREAAARARLEGLFKGGGTGATTNRGQGGRAGIEGTFEGGEAGTAADRASDARKKLDDLFKKRGETP